MKKLKLSIQGMHCASCSTNIGNSLMKVHGVKSANINVIMKKGYIEVEDKIDKKELEKAVSRVGNYKLIKIEEE